MADRVVPAPDPVPDTRPSVDADPPQDVPPATGGRDATPVPGQVPDGPVRWRSPHTAGESPTELAATLVEAEREARDPTLSDARRAAAGARAQIGWTRLGAEPGWHDAVLAALPADLRDDARLHLRARGELDELVESDLPAALPAWEVVAPAPPDELLAHYREAGADQGVAWTTLAAINLVETRMGRIRGLSSAGARGPMQFIPASWEIYGEGGDIDDPRDAIAAAARHLRDRGGEPYDRATALFRYNNSQRYVAAVSAYADLLEADPDAYHGLWGWQVFFRTRQGTFLLPEGYREEQPVPVEAYLQRPEVVAPGPGAG